MKIAASIVTFNRLEFLKEIVQSLRDQSRKLDHIIVVNNNSEDGTKEWLESQEELIVYHQDNLGSSGGQNASIKQLQKTDADYFWIMDDDVVPRENCLEELEKHLDPNRILSPIRLNPDGSIFWNDTIKFNMSNPISSFWQGIIDDDYYKSYDEFVPAVGLTFEGPIFHRSVIDKIGYAEQNFFIYGDDSEFMIKADKAGYEIGVIKSAVIDRKLAYVDPNNKFSWKHYYIIRNGLAIDRLHGTFLVKNIRPLIYYIKWLGKANSTEDKQVVKKAFKDAWSYPEKLSNKAIGYK